MLDQNSAALPETTVNITQVGTGFSREAKSNQDGNYTVADLPVGVYRISAAHAGFKEGVVESVTVNVATTTRQDLSMEVGNVGERVEIVASDLQIDTETGAGGEVNGEQVRELLLTGRSLQLTQLQPGVSPAANFDSKTRAVFRR